jgi:PAS domain S-box-containing protein
MKIKRMYILWSLFFGVIVPIILFLICKVFMAQWSGVNVPLHAVFETLGLFTGILLAIILLQQIDRQKKTSYYVLVSSALIAMGLMDGFHAVIGPGNTFVWLHSMAVLIGGILFALIALPIGEIPMKKTWRIPVFVATVSIALGIFSMLFPAILPIMIQEGNFTLTASLINVLGGSLFVLASFCFIIRLWNNKNTLEILLTIFCLLVGSAAILFPFGQTWTTVWWMWHFLRLIAYFVLFGYVLYVISEKKYVKQELIKNKKLLDEAGRLASVGGWEIDLKANSLYWSETTYKIHEVEPGFIPNLETAINFYAPEAIPVISQCIDRTIKMGEPFDEELELITAKKNRIWVRAIGEAYRENGEIVKIGGMFQNINDRKLAEIESRKKSEELQLLSNELEIIIDSIPGLVFYKDTNNRFIRVNKYMCDAYKMSKKQLEGTSINDLHSKEQALAYWEDDLQVIRSHQSKINIDEPWETKTGNRWVSTSKIPYMDEKGEVIGVIGVSIDVTERRLAEEELKKHRDHLEDMVKQRTEDLSNILTEVKETVNVLNASSSEILAATTQVASGTAETATAISETSTTVEEVQQAVKQTVEKAKNVANSAQRMAQVSQNGQKAVEETVNGMNRIREQMDSIAQTVIRLSEQSQSIGGIIASVTEIADQSNLLAVNAAIEAAKAGEQGKGFAVVAQEIKNLAGQSKQATSQVRNILNDVQKATGAAVMATEQGSKAVEAGVKQAAQAGEAIRKLAESSNEAVQATTQIVASSQQQVVGMDQIGVAMQNINQAGTETAVSMVQSEKSAKSLNELGQKLKEMVERFKE